MNPWDLASHWSRYAISGLGYLRGIQRLYRAPDGILAPLGVPGIPPGFLQIQIASQALHDISAFSLWYRIYVEQHLVFTEASSFWLNIEHKKCLLKVFDNKEKSKKEKEPICHLVCEV